ncbi:MAG: ATPase, T2SS/T4P/T4SS family [Phycisphaerales bacterium]|nr:Flp pilus assembly complex ATPase component TadA [Phycisphaerales bacterium]
MFLSDGALTLRLASNQPDIGTIELGERPIRVGRHPDNDVCITDGVASRHHCVIEPADGGTYILKDLGSRNGTKVNGRRVEVVLLSDGDIVSIGKFAMHVEFDKPMFETHSAPAPAFEREPEPASESAVFLDDEPVEGLGSFAGVHNTVQSPNAMRRASGKDRGKRVKPGKEWIAELSSIAEGLPDTTPMDTKIVLLDADGKPSNALESSADGAVATRLLLIIAARSRATDIHVEPKDDNIQVRMRVDGQMISVTDLPTQVGDLFVGLIRTACLMAQAGRDAIQDGHFAVKWSDRRVDFRASITPTVRGQKLVVRVLDARIAPQRLSEMGMPPYMEEAVRKLCQQDTGFILAAGPTGSGKTTTLYNAMREIDRERRNVVTIEDPVEYHIEGVTQIPVGRDTRFAELLRSILRQDPDVILVGEIRDEETARTAMQASMTGHVVFSTIHAKDSIGAVFRLLDLGVEPYLVANAMNLVIAQRLVRSLCDSCKRAVAVTPGQATRCGKYMEGKHQTFVPTGCGRCLRTGFVGRRAIFEMLLFDDELRDCVLHNPTIQKMKKVIEQGVFRTLQQSGWVLAGQGLTSLDEVDKVAGWA